MSEKRISKTWILTNDTSDGQWEVRYFEDNTLKHSAVFPTYREANEYAYKYDNKVTMNRSGCSCGCGWAAKWTGDNNVGVGPDGRVHGITPKEDKE